MAGVESPASACSGRPLRAPHPAAPRPTRLSREHFARQARKSECSKGKSRKIADSAGRGRPIESAGQSVRCAHGPLSKPVPAVYSARPTKPRMAGTSARFVVRESAGYVATGELDAAKKSRGTAEISAKRDGQCDGHPERSGGASEKSPRRKNRLPAEVIEVRLRRLKAAGGQSGGLGKHAGLARVRVAIHSGPSFH